MCQPLPYAEFQWFEDAVNFDVSAIASIIFSRSISSIRSIYMTDLSFCPTRDKPPSKREDKLLALFDKQRYVIHYRNL